jgi:O-antigen/teichoic acid export membrane protein
VLNLILIPPFGMTGAAISMVASYFAMFLGITWKAQRVFPVIYQWRRVALAIGAAVALVVTGKVVHGGLAAAIGLTALYPFALAGVGFYLPQERERIVAFAKRFMLGRD